MSSIRIWYIELIFICNDYMRVFIFQGIFDVLLLSKEDSQPR